ncbi:MAG: methyltransferase domain-containing protein [Bacteroidota bacterium]
MKLYSYLKKIVYTFFPKKVIQQNEERLRYLYANLFYRGKNCQCNICTKKFSRFILLDNGNLVCPYCGSLSRNRRLWQILKEKKLLKGNILHFSPNRALYRVLKQLNYVEYTSTDFVDEFLADKKLNITNIASPAERFDLVICYHVLEHIEEDQLAMSELYRVLKIGGIVMIQTPFREGEIYEDATIKSPQERLKYFGQEDHVRIYSVEGLIERLEKVGFQSEVLTFNEASTGMGLKVNENVILAYKTNS